ncbi:DUF1810 domain-containing protein [Desulfomicrobium escambiense]|uniref:DUF1810 domain-containing protein n=1 Tax=Desulfomicrobium escambiense TaxID=29503 RepID=UPI00042A0FC5|nr:DUF1810 domain-containing protein [Desulfomicrobium escambiense]
MHADDPFDLSRFVQAQEGVYASALAELCAGRKTSHWMWFVFPQIDGLGRSQTARFFAVKSLAEARAYLAHPVLGKRLRECTSAVLAVADRTASEIFGYPDEIKFRSSMTLFERADSDCALFSDALNRFFGGGRDPMTLEILAGIGS